jgi:SAM-dependent methyltransferase
VTVVLLTVAVLACAGVWLGWRGFSRRRSLPCPAWLSWMVDNPLSMRRTSSAVSHLQLAPGMNVLDAGCGPGRLSVPIAEAVAPQGKVLAVDVQPDMLRRARAKAARTSLSNIEFLHAALGEGKLPRAQFDRAVLSTVLGEIPDRVAALREIHAALKPGGFLLVNEVVGDPHYQSVAKVKVLAGEAGFRIGMYRGNRLAFSINLEKREDGTDTP